MEIPTYLNCTCSTRILRKLTSDTTGLGRTRQKPDLDYFLQTETRTRFFNINPNQTRVLICDETKYKNPTKNPNPAEPEAKTQPDPKPEPECLNPSRTRLFETHCITTTYNKGSYETILHYKKNLNFNLSVQKQILTFF